MKRVVASVAIAVLLIGLVLLGISDTRIAIADTVFPDSEITTSQTEASNSSASATITITMYAVADE